MLHAMMVCIAGCGPTRPESVSDDAIFIGDRFHGGFWLECESWRIGDVTYCEKIGPFTVFEKGAYLVDRDQSKFGDCESLGDDSRFCRNFSHSGIHLTRARHFKKDVQLISVNVTNTLLRPAIRKYVVNKTCLESFSSFNYWAIKSDFSGNNQSDGKRLLVSALLEQAGLVQGGSAYEAVNINRIENSLFHGSESIYHVEGDATIGTLEVGFRLLGDCFASFRFDAPAT